MLTQSLLHPFWPEEKWIAEQGPPLTGPPCLFGQQSLHSALRLLGKQGLGVLALLTEKLRSFAPEGRFP